MVGMIFQTRSRTELAHFIRGFGLEEYVRYQDCEIRERFEGVRETYSIPDEILLYTGFKKEQKLERRIAFLADTFLDIRYHVEVFYEYYFGIIEIEETMRTDQIAVC